MTFQSPRFIPLAGILTLALTAPAFAVGAAAVGAAGEPLEPVIDGTRAPGPTCVLGPASQSGQQEMGVASGEAWKDSSIVPSGEIDEGTVLGSDDSGDSFRGMDFAGVRPTGSGSLEEVPRS